MIQAVKSSTPNSIRVRVLRQDKPDRESYWEYFDVPYEPNMNVISILQKGGAIGRTEKDTEVLLEFCNRMVNK